MESRAKASKAGQAPIRLPSRVARANERQRRHIRHIRHIQGFVGSTAKRGRRAFAVHAAMSGQIIPFSDPLLRRIDESLIYLKAGVRLP